MDSNISKDSRLSARRRAQHRTKSISRVHHVAKRAVLWGLSLAVFLLLSSCQGKSNGQHLANEKKEHQSGVSDSLHNPKIDIKVNKRYDEKGNLIGFDSTYSSYYSSLHGDTAKMDSVFSSFDKYFKHHHSSLFRNEFNTLFFNDSVRYPDFFHKDYFMKRYELNDAYLRGMMHRMDSIKNQFYQQNNKNTAGL